MDDAEVDFWTPTIQAFAPLQLDGPELTPKLLKRPPFRFIADIVTSINNRFAAYDHIFRPDQLDPSSIDTKEKKIEYLTTLVKYVSSLLGQKIDVNVKKIVSGSEPERTNIFLQCLALAVGYAQQDKAKRAQQQQQEKQPNQVNYSIPLETSGPSSDSLQQQELPRRISNPAKKASKKEIAIREAAELYNKVNGFGYLKLDEIQSVKEIGRSIVDMYNELQRNTIETQPTPLPEEALETAIKRQIEAIQQVEALQEENNNIVEKLEILLTS